MEGEKHLHAEARHMRVLTEAHTSMYTKRVKCKKQVRKKEDNLRQKSVCVKPAQASATVCYQEVANRNGT